MHVRIATSEEAGSYAPRETGVYFFLRNHCTTQNRVVLLVCRTTDMETTKMTATQKFAKPYGITIRHDVTARTKCLANRNFAWVVDIEWASRTIEIAYKTDRFTTTFAHRDGRRWERYLCIEMTNNNVRRLIAEILPLVSKIADGIGSGQDVADLLLDLDRAVWRANEDAIQG